MAATADARGDVSRPEGFGTANPHWPLVPQGPVADVAVVHTCHAIAARLTAAGIRAPQLAEQLGDSESSWRSKLNGSRSFTLPDVLRIALAVDIEVLHVLPHNLMDVTPLIPAPYRALLTHKQANRGMPSFRATAPVWESLAAAAEEWWTSEEGAGRRWSLGLDVLVNAALRLGDDHGLPSIEAAQEFRTEEQKSIVWPARSVRLTTHWTPADVHSTEAIKQAMASAAAAIWPTGRVLSTVDTSVLLIAGAPEVIANIDVALGTHPTDGQDVLSIGVAAALGHPTATQVRDVHVTWRRRGRNLLWLGVKS